MTGPPAFEGATWHDSFARCPECGHATVGLSKPYGINHAAGCSMPPIPASGGSGEAPASVMLPVCDNCGDLAECEPGDECEVCCEGTIQRVEYAPVRALTREQQVEAAHDAIALYDEALADGYGPIEAKGRVLSHCQALEGAGWALEAERDRLKRALSDLLSEFDGLADAFSALKRRHEPPYVNYASWAKPAVLAALSFAGPGGETADGAEPRTWKVTLCEECGEVGAYRECSIAQHTHPTREVEVVELSHCLALEEAIRAELAERNARLPALYDTNLAYAEGAVRALEWVLSRAALSSAGPHG